ncbi:YigZ family protein [Mycetocola lacteus]|uniref:YigZ family protein n=1 Tax=Mycetocola lacteus TaxID=76637 RepID=A0A3L7AUD6_9MICO|nr:YigZ family protein [Mycetocola lacteus]RLP84149.1 YigZ family protein [Mycetocola lacteus]
MTTFVPPGYRTIAAPVETEQEIKRSRFICFLTPVADEEEARAEIARVRALHPKARHHCTAFVLGERGQLKRSNDDGEPSGTAGAPMLDAIDGSELTFVVAIVVRYFGGILLGAGGLTRAYRAAVAEAVTHAKILRFEPRERIAVTLDYSTAAVVEAEALRRGWSIGEVEYGAAVTLRLGIPPEDREVAAERIAAHTAGAATIVDEGFGFVSVGAVE